MNAGQQLRGQEIPDRRGARGGKCAFISTVYRALALISWYLTNDAVAKYQEFHAEMGMLQMLRHPHIVNFYGAITTGTHPYLGTAQCIITERCFNSMYHVLKKYGHEIIPGPKEVRSLAISYDMTTRVWPMFHSFWMSGFLLY
jgi:serine/threonine protein kinase